MGMTAKILLGTFGGLALGLFFGEPMGRLGFVGDVFVGLLQMTVLPFIAVSLIANIGRFSLAEGSRLAKAGILVILVLWAIALVSLVVISWSYPELETGSFFTTSLVESRDKPDFMKLYVPSNIFGSLAGNLVPAVVLFCLLVGIALIGIEKKQVFLEQLDVLSQALIQVNRFVVKLTPIGVFAIAASAAGTITMEEFGRLQGYLISHTLVSLILAFVVLPGMVAVMTPLKYGAILRATQTFLLTAFVTGSLFAVLPMLIDAVNKLLEDQGWEPGDSHVTPEVLVPLAYPFPTVGKLLSLIFIPFASWFVGKTMAVMDFVVFLSAGLFSSFVSIAVTIPFLLDLLQLPTDMFNLFLMAGVWSARISDLAGGMHLLAFTILVIYLIDRRTRLQWKRVPGLLLLTLLIFTGTIQGTRAFLNHNFAGKFVERDVLASMQILETPVPTQVLAEAAPNPTPLEKGQSRLERIRERGILRVGYSPTRIPFSYTNINGEIVGFDIDMAYRLAGDLGVALELVPMQYSTVAQQLADDHFDIAMSALEGTIGRAETMSLSPPYLDLSLASVIQDHRKDEFASIEAIREIEDLKIAVLEDSFYAERLRHVLPREGIDAEIIELERERDFFNGTVEADGLVTSAEAGSAFTLFYPSYHVRVPLRPPLKVPLVYGFARDAEDLDDFLEAWIELRKRDRTIDLLFNHWILGIDERREKPRWSIARDVLGWFD